jgi:hypothetical protein
MKWWVESRGVKPIDVAVKCGNKAAVAHAEFVEILIGLQLAAKAIQVPTFSGIAWVSIVVKLICQHHPRYQQ